MKGKLGRCSHTMLHSVVFERKKKSFDTNRPFGHEFENLGEKKVFKVLSMMPVRGASSFF